MGYYYIANAATGVNSSFLCEAAQGDSSFGCGVTFFSSQNVEFSSTVTNRHKLQRISGGTVPVTRTPEKGNSRSSAAITVGHVSWTTIPAYTGNPLILCGAEEAAGQTTFGPRQFNWWLLNPRYPIVVDPSGYIGLGTDTTEFDFPFGAILGVREGAFDCDQRRIARRGRTRGFWHHKDYRNAFVNSATTGADRNAPEFYMIQHLDWDLTQQTPQWNINLFGGAAGTVFTQSIDGTLTPAGALVKQINKIVAGTLTPAANVLKLTTKTMTGTVTPAGAISKQTFKTMSGTITPAGTLLEQIVFTKILAGSLSFSGQLVKMTLKSLVGVLTPTGALNKQTSKSMSGTLTPIGTLLHNATFVRALTGTLNAIADLLELFIPGTPPIGGNPNWVSTWIKSVWRRGGK